MDDGSIDEPLEKEAFKSSELSRIKIRSHMCWLTVVNALMLGITVALNSLGKTPWSIKDMNTCVKATSFYSPVIGSKIINFHQVQLNGTLWPGEDPSWSRKEIGDPEAEEIWDAFEFAETFPISYADVVALGKDPETVTRYPNEKFGLGEEAYVASLDIQHKLHCLDELRKMTFADYGESTPKKKAHGQLWWIHLRHCFDMLTQDMLCHADADLITYRWMDTQPDPFPDFSINRKCRNLDEVLQYRDEHKVDDEKYTAMKKPKSEITQVPAEPGYYAMFGFEDSDLYPNGEGYGSLPESDWFGIPERPSSSKGHRLQV
ncbi:MAG: hypothetical protein ALECFALPRED_000637 [Alectoria fallacina]|uniref:Tat pathway signal sequence n=1 Tax=Alectoria fallacina TaxID=1903189 RepID=A0A8H3I7Z8_9LECA|nr:MAG: hypothetical protein ALECFALPRED_000637 [Alectoria fallacina]